MEFVLLYYEIADKVFAIYYRTVQFTFSYNLHFQLNMFNINVFTQYKTDLSNNRRHLFLVSDR